MENRIHYYQSSDLSYGHYLSIIDKFILEFSNMKIKYNINDIIELYNISLYISDKFFCEVTTILDKDLIIKTNKELKKIVAKYFKDINTDKIVELFDLVDLNYRNSFWQIISKFNVHISISTDIFTHLLDEYNIFEYILYNKMIVQKFDAEIRDYMLKTPVTAEKLLNCYEVQKRSTESNMYFPKSLCNDDKVTILNYYLDLDCCSHNYVDILATMQSSKDTVVIPDGLILKAKNKLDDLNEHFFDEENNNILKSGNSFNIEFSNKQIEPVIVSSNNNETNISYSTSWFEQNLDYPTLLNNFIYLFDFFDEHMRWKLFSRKIDTVFMEDIQTKSKKSYSNGYIFSLKDSESIHKLYLYYFHLSGYSIRLEDIAEWFFNEYILNEFNIDGFHVTMPSKESTTVEKCRNVMPVIESALNQFQLYVRDKKIDHKLLSVQSKQLIYDNIPSLNEKKYVYGNSDEYSSVSLLLFSSQSGLFYTEKFKEKYSTFFDLISNENMSLTDFYNYQVKLINWLIHEEYLVVNSDEKIKFRDICEIKILKDLYLNEFINYWHFNINSRKIIDKLAEKN